MDNSTLLSISNKDSEYISRMHKAQENAPKIRRWMIAFLIPLTILYIAVVIYAVNAVQQLGNRPGGLGMVGVGPGFVIGILIGLKMALLLLGLVHFWLIAIFTKTRERDLMLRFHDYLAERQMIEIGV